MNENENEMLETLARAGVGIDAATTAWRESLRLLAAFDAVGRDGASAVVKIDGGRTAGQVYTVVVSGGRLGEDFFHKDGADLQALLREAINFYAACVRVGR